MLRSANAQTYQRLLEYFQDLMSHDELPRDKRGYIERTQQPPITHFLNVSVRNHQGIPMRLGHISISPEKSIHLDLLAWMQEQLDQTHGQTPAQSVLSEDQAKQQILEALKNELIIDLVSIAEIRNTPVRQDQEIAV